MRLDSTTRRSRELAHAPGRSRATGARGTDALRTKGLDGAHALWRGRRGDVVPRGQRPDLENLPGHGETRWPRPRAGAADTSEDVRGAPVRGGRRPGHRDCAGAIGAVRRTGVGAAGDVYR